MRQLIVYVPQGKGQGILETTEERLDLKTIRLDGKGLDKNWDVIFIHAENAEIEEIIGELQSIEDLHVSLSPSGIIALKPPVDKAPDQVIDVSARSPLEIFLSGLQSIGSWKGFLGYAFAAGIVVWIALFTNTIFLLTAAMLIAPFASPAMTLAMGTARGDKELISQSVLRYFTALLVTIFAAWLLSLLLQQEMATSLMVDRSKISAVAVLLPLVAGAAGALNLCQSERDSLVTAAGTGMLVAASLAPPAGVVGMSLAIGEWAMAKSGFFVLVLQLVGINLSGALVFWLFGLKPKGTRYERGQNWLRWTSLAASCLALFALLIWQFQNPPELQRATHRQFIESEIKTALKQNELVAPVEVDVRFTRADIPGQNSLLVQVFAQRKSPAQEADDSLIKKQLREQISKLIRMQNKNVTPLVDVTLLEP